MAPFPVLLSDPSIVNILPHLRCHFALSLSACYYCTSWSAARVRGGPEAPSHDGSAGASWGQGPSLVTPSGYQSREQERGCGAAMSSQAYQISPVLALMSLRAFFVDPCYRRGKQQCVPPPSSPLPGGASPTEGAPLGSSIFLHETVLPTSQYARRAPVQCLADLRGGTLESYLHRGRQSQLDEESACGGRAGLQSCPASPGPPGLLTGQEKRKEQARLRRWESAVGDGGLGPQRTPPSPPAGLARGALLPPWSSSGSGRSLLGPWTAVPAPAPCAASPEAPRRPRPRAGSSRVCPAARGSVDAGLVVRLLL